MFDNKKKFSDIENQKKLFGDSFFFVHFSDCALDLKGLNDPIDSIVLHRTI